MAEFQQTQTETPGERIERTARELGLTMTAVFVPFSQSRNAKPSDGKPRPSLNWRVTIRHRDRDFLTTDYSAGYGHCPGYKNKDHWVRDNLVAYEVEHGLRGTYSEPADTVTGSRKHPLLPDFCDVLASLARDSDVLDYGTFEEWADDFNYDPDSRKAEAAYRACLDIALKLRNALGEDGLRQLREASQEY